MRRITYDEIRTAMRGQRYEMNLVGKARDVVVEAVNQGIDSHLEACYVQGRDEYSSECGGRLLCRVSPESLPVLLRRMDDMDETPLCEEASQLSADILNTLGFDVEAECYVIFSPADEAERKEGSDERTTCTQV